MVQVLIPTSNGPLPITVEPGGSIVFLGANGSGKTRLGVRIEQTAGVKSELHRIGAHRSLNLNTMIQPPTYQIAENRLLYGYEKGNHGHRHGHRWGNAPATALLSDFDHVVAALYADENRISILHRQSHLADLATRPPTTRLDRLKEIWHSVLPHRELVVLDGDIKVKSVNSDALQYNASDLSDGERVIFYLIGQVLLMRADSIVIVDEPELHLNKAILAKLWDRIESSRKDCGFIYFTHDIEFTISRISASKFTINSYENNLDGEQWEIEPIPLNSGIPDDVVTRIAGSRLPILFTEGAGGSLDSSLYRQVYREFTTIPVGSCDHVIHSVKSFSMQSSFHRLGCAGIVDLDNRDKNQQESLASINVSVLPVAEVENILLLQKPFLALAKLMKFDDVAARDKFKLVKQFTLKEAKKDIELYCINATRRRVDAAAKTVGLEAKSINDLETEFTGKIAKIDVKAIYAEYKKDMDAALASANYSEVLRFYDNKGLLAEAARILGFKGRKELEEFIVRNFQALDGQEFLQALRAELPNVKVNRSVGILTYGSIIDDPGAEIKTATLRTLTTGIRTPFFVEFARSSSNRKGAPTLVPVADGGSSVKAQIIALKENISEEEAQNLVWRRETRRPGTYSRPISPTTNDVLVEHLNQFHGFGVVYYAKIGGNINDITAQKLAQLAIASAKAVAAGELSNAQDGISYLLNAKKNGIVTALSNDYEAEILNQTGAANLEEALKKIVG